jgi:hypothetical protein
MQAMMMAMLISIMVQKTINRLDKVRSSERILIVIT